MNEKEWKEAHDSHWRQVARDLFKENEELRKRLNDIEYILWWIDDQARTYTTREGLLNFILLGIIKIGR